jgi:hypothetical protein
VSTCKVRSGGEVVWVMGGAQVSNWKWWRKWVSNRRCLGVKLEVEVNVSEQLEVTRCDIGSGGECGWVIRAAQV